MLRISWPLAILLAVVIALTARRLPRGVFVALVVLFAVWMLWQMFTRRGRR